MVWERMGVEEELCWRQRAAAKSAALGGRASGGGGAPALIGQVASATRVGLASAEFVRYKVF